MTQSIVLIPSRSLLGNVLVITKTYQTTGVAQHAKTQRWTYTIPTSRIFYNRGHVCFALRNAGAATGTGVVLITIENGSNIVLQASFLMSTTNNTGTSGIAGSFAGGTSPFLAGEVLSGYTSDTFTTDSIDIYLNMHGVECDAI